MKKRLNRSLSSVKSLAPCFMPLRVRHTSAYDFTCRHCGEILQPEKEVFSLLDAMFKNLNADAGKTDPDPEETGSIRDFLAEVDELRRAPSPVRVRGTKA